MVIRGNLGYKIYFVSSSQPSYIFFSLPNITNQATPHLLTHILTRYLTECHDGVRGQLQGGARSALLQGGLLPGACE
jgi:hypothetical protein